MLEGDPHSVIEGMASPPTRSARTQGYIYVRAEYPLAVERLQHRHRPGPRVRPAGQEHPRHRLRFRPRDPHGLRRVRLRRGDRADDLDRGQPRRAAPAPPFPAVKGLWGKPSVLNNVETYANVAADHPQRRRRGTPASAPRRARAPRSSPWPARSTTPAWSKCPWACRWARSSTTSAAASPTARSSRPCRSAAPPAAASPSSTSTCPWTTNRSRSSAPSWAPAA